MSNAPVCQKDLHRLGELWTKLWKLCKTWPYLRHWGENRIFPLG